MDGKERRCRAYVQTKKITTLFKNYLSAFKAYDLNKVVACYHLPCTLNTPDKVVLLTSIDACRQEFANIFAQLKGANISEIIARKASYALITENLLLASIDWEFIDEQGEMFADFCAIYHLTLVENELKIINVVSHDLSNSLTLTNMLKLTN